MQEDTIEQKDPQEPPKWELVFAQIDRLAEVHFVRTSKDHGIILYKHEGAQSFLSPVNIKDGAHKFSDLEFEEIVHSLKCIREFWESHEWERFEDLPNNRLIIRIRESRHEPAPGGPPEAATTAPKAPPRGPEMSDEGTKRRMSLVQTVNDDGKISLKVNTGGSLEDLGL